MALASDGVPVIILALGNTVPIFANDFFSVSNPVTSEVITNEGSSTISIGIPADFDLSMYMAMTVRGDGMMIMAFSV